MVDAHVEAVFLALRRCDALPVGQSPNFFLFHHSQAAHLVVVVLIDVLAFKELGDRVSIRAFNNIWFRIKPVVFVQFGSVARGDQN